MSEPKRMTDAMLQGLIDNDDWGPLEEETLLDEVRRARASEAAKAQDYKTVVAANEAMREPMRKLREVMGMASESVGAVIDAATKHVESLRLLAKVNSDAAQRCAQERDVAVVDNAALVAILRDARAALHEGVPGQDQRIKTLVALADSGVPHPGAALLERLKSLEDERGRKADIEACCARLASERAGLTVEASDSPADIVLALCELLATKEPEQ